MEFLLSTGISAGVGTKECVFQESGKSIGNPIVAVSIVRRSGI
jgi:hypothetical protein